MKYNLKSEFKTEVFDQYVKKLKDKKAYVELREIRMKRNLDQNGLYWLWLTCIQQESGTPKEELHILFRAKFLKRSDEYVETIIKPVVWARIKEITDQFHYRKEIKEVIDLIAKSTTELEIDEFARYMNAIKDFTKENFGIPLLTLKDLQFDEFQKEYYTYQ